VLQKQRLQVCPSERISFNSTGKYRCNKCKRLQVCPSERISFNSTGKPKKNYLIRREERKRRGNQRYILAEKREERS